MLPGLDASNRCTAAVAPTTIKAPARCGGAFDIDRHGSEMPLVAGLRLRCLVLHHGDLQLGRGIPLLHLGEVYSVSSDRYAVHGLPSLVVPLSVQAPAALVRAVEVHLHRASVPDEHNVDLSHRVLGHGDCHLIRLVPVQKVVEGHPVIADHQVLYRLAVLVEALTVKKPARLHGAVNVHLNRAEVPLVGDLRLGK